MAAQKGGEGEEDGGKGEQLRLRLEINLDVEIQLKAKIHGDLTIGLLYVLPSILIPRITFLTATSRN